MGHLALLVAQLQASSNAAQAVIDQLRSDGLHIDTTQAAAGGGTGHEKRSMTTEGWIMRAFDAHQGKSLTVPELVAWINANGGDTGLNTVGARASQMNKARKLSWVAPRTYMVPPGRDRADKRDRGAGPAQPQREGKARPRRGVGTTKPAQGQTMTDYAMRAIDTLVRDSREPSTEAIVEEMIRAGYPGNHTNLRVSINPTLSAAARKGRLRKTGRGVYQPVR